MEIAFTRDGILVGLSVVFTHDIGMYGALVAPVITACTVPGPYRIPTSTPSCAPYTRTCRPPPRSAAPADRRACS